MNYYLCFDAGTQSIKVAVYDVEGNNYATAVNPTSLFYPDNGWVEMDVEEYYKLALDGIKSCVEQLKEKNLNPNDIKAISGDGIICGIAGVDESGKAITPFINYLDSRTKSDAENLSRLNLNIWANETGNPEPLCLFPALFARWFLKNSPVARNIKKFVHNAPYVLMRLGGLKADKAFIDKGTMSGWGLGYDVVKKIWSEVQLKALHIDKNFMPEIKNAWDITGYLTREAANYTGLKAGIPICAGAGDTMQSLLACGVFETGHAVDVAGTCSMFCISTDKIIPGLSKKGTGLIFNSGTLEDTYFYWGFVRTGGLALRWFRDNICGRVGDDEYYKYLSEGAEKIPAGANGVRFLPYLTGGFQGSENLKGSFINVGLDTNQFTLWRAVLEAIAGEYSEIAERCRNAGTPVDKIIITEGGSKDNLWNQIKADLIQAETVTLQTGGALAVNALIGAYATGEIKDLKEKLHSVLTQTASFKPGEPLKLNTPKIIF